MLSGAPLIDEVLPQFMEFVGDRVVVAHNAKFDTGFIRAACRKQGIAYNLTAVDTLSLSQQLMPQLNRYKLDIVAKALKLPNFNHHRAADDSNICGQILVKLARMLDDMGLKSLQEASAYFATKPSKGVIFAGRPYHIILLAKNQTGLRNLYHLISASNLDYFKKVPRIPKSLLMELREGLIIGSACEAGELFQAITAGKPMENIKNIAAFYDEARLSSIAGSIDGVFNAENLNLNEVADIEFDLSIKESTETPIYRMVSNDYLMEFFRVGAISIEDLLEFGTFPFADKMLQNIQARKAEMQAAQQGQTPGSAPVQ
jgi:DNA polymerase-3 subunit alpha (Gram-positive type)